MTHTLTPEAIALLDAAVAYYAAPYFNKDADRDLEAAACGYAYAEQRTRELLVEDLSA